MDDIGRMDVQAASEKLVHEILTMVVFEVLSWVNDSVHVSLHQISDDVNIVEASWLWRLLHVDQADDIFMIEELQQFDFSNDSLRINQIFKSLGYFLDGNLSLDGVVKCWAHDTISTMSYLLDVLVFVLTQELCSSTLKRNHALGDFRSHLLWNLILMLLLLLLQSCLLLLLLLLLSAVLLLWVLLSLVSIVLLAGRLRLLLNGLLVSSLVHFSIGF